MEYILIFLKEEEEKIEFKKTERVPNTWNIAYIPRDDITLGQFAFWERMKLDAFVCGTY
jgi:hypothetical protein